MQAQTPEVSSEKATTGRKTVTRYGMTFTVISSRERLASAGGRFFLCTGRDCDGWTLFEHDSDLLETGSAKLIGRKFDRLENTQALATEINRLLATGDKLPSDVRPPWIIDQARHDQCMRGFAANRLKAVVHGETVVYHTLRWCGRIIREFIFTTVADEYDGESTQRAAHHFDARDLPEQYQGTGKPLEWIRAALNDGFELSQIYTFRDDQVQAAQGGAA